MKAPIFCFLVIASAMLMSCQQQNKMQQSAVNSHGLSNKYTEKIDSIIGSLTLEQKIGQLNQLNNNRHATGPDGKPIADEKRIQMVREGMVGSFLNVMDAELSLELQKVAVEESPTGIPLVFGLDVIHGYKTMFPIPLGEAAMWDTAQARINAQIAAHEATADGIQWTFAPMVDVTRDPRWGRQAETAGEDPFLGKLMAVARVQGFQQNNLAAPNSMAACLKHFVGYGLSQAGRDYWTTDVSDRELRETFLPPFKAGCDAGAATIMSAFNELNGVPASGNKYTLNHILRNEWGWDGMVVSDWASVYELIPQGAAKDSATAAEIGINSGVDMEMVSRTYVRNLKTLVEQGRVSIATIDKAVRRVLLLKFRLGLFDNPYQYGNVDLKKELHLAPNHLEQSLKSAEKSMVLLENNGILPLNKKQKVALIGPLVKPLKTELGGTWAWTGDTASYVHLLEAMENKIGKDNIIYAKGCGFDTTIPALTAQAIKAAQQADVVVMHMGERIEWSGEAHSLTDISLKPAQLSLIKKIKATGKPVVVILSHGRALTLPWVSKNADALIAGWFLGTRSGDAMANVLYGDYNPSGKLPTTFPRNVGQIPLYYNHKSSGRPLQRPGQSYVSFYLDAPNTPLYPFGYGLSYTTFGYSDINTSVDTLPMGTQQSITITANVTNTGKVAGTEVVQFYIRDPYTYGVGRPVKELKGFKRIYLKPGETQKVAFNITEKDLEFIKLDNTVGAEAGVFYAFVGGNSVDCIKKEFYLAK